MFEKEAKKWVKEHTEIDYKASYGEFSKEPSAIKSFKAGAQFGYDKANEWHYVKDGDLPKDFGYYLVALKSVAYKGFVFEVVYFTGSIFTKEGEISDNVYAWKEIVLPELPKESEIRSDMFPEIILPEGSAEFVEKIIADAEKRLKESE